MLRTRPSIVLFFTRSQRRRHPHRQVLLALGALVFLAVLLGPPPPAAAVVSSFRSTDAIALTFDDGPDPVNTPALLSLLASYGVHATFFVVGTEVARHPDLLRAEVAAGHEIGLHTYYHRALPRLSNGALLADLGAESRLLQQVAGTHTILVRPPYGSLSERTTTTLREAGYEVVFWSADTRDWASGQAAIQSFLINQVKPGDIVLMHDGGGPRAATIAALAAALPVWIGRHWHFRTISQLPAGH